MFKEYKNYDAIGLAELIKNKQVSAAEVLTAAVAAADELNPRLNAIIHRFEQRAFAAIEQGLPQGAFHGVPFLLKDLSFILKGEPYTMGSRGVKTTPSYNSHIVEHYLNAGLNIFGKTNTPELGLIITTEPKAHGVCHNPFKQGYSSGGSSGGSAAAVAAGIVPMAGSGDGGGSIRFPAAWCGVFGFKPSRGRTPLGPDYGEAWHGAVIDHVISRTVRDSALALDVAHGNDTGAPYIIAAPEKSFLAATNSKAAPMKIALAKKPLIENTSIEPEVLALLEKTAANLQDMGHVIEEAEPVIDLEMFWHSFIVVVTAYTAFNYDQIAQKYGKNAVAKLEPATKNMAMIGRSIRANQLVHAMHNWHLIQLEMGRFLQRYDAMLCPTVPTVAVKHGVLPPTKIEEVLMSISQYLPIGRLLLNSPIAKQMSHKVLSKMAFTILGNITGLPAMSLPLGMSAQNLPIGMQIVGKMCADEQLFSLAADIERAQLFAATAVNLTTT